MPTQLVGILNITPDSFSDGGDFIQTDNAVKQSLKLIDDGANIIDIGAESTRPGASIVTPDQEWERLKEIVPNIKSNIKDKNIPISVDTRNSYTAQKALENGAEIINDVSGISEPKMLDVIKDFNAKIVITHNLGVPADKNIIIDKNKDEIEIVYQWARDKIDYLVNNKIDIKNIIFDIGIGFGKDATQSFNLLWNLDKYKNLGVPIYVGHSRKSFLNIFEPKSIKERDYLTSIISAQIQSKVDFLRVHNVALNKRAIDFFKGY